VERCIHDLAGFLARRGHTVTVITSTPARPRTAYEGDVEVIYVRQPNHPLIYQYAVWLRPVDFAIIATRLMAKMRPDVSYLWSYSGIMWAPLIRKSLAIPYFFHMMMRDHAFPGRLGQALFARLLKGADQVAALTRGGALAVEKEFKVSCEVLPPPVDLDIFQPSAPRDLSRPVVLFPADLVDPRKGGTLLLSAWSRVHQNCPEARLVLAGPFGLAGWFMYDFANTMLARFHLVDDPSARAAIELRGPGPVEALPAWYSQAAVTVLPSFDEAFGMVLTESLACGTPVVGSSHGGPGEIISDGVGATVDLRNYDDVTGTERADQLADAILHCIDLSRRAGTQTRCREWASQWDLKRIGLKAERLLTQIASAQVQGSKPAREEMVAIR